MGEKHLPLPVTVLGGYLGSGKTTLVNHLLRNANGLRLAVLVNEFGELAIDEDLIEGEKDQILSLAGGCVCCSYGSDLMLTLSDLHQMDPRPEHVLIEASGVAIPGAIAGSVTLVQNYALEGIIVLCDAETIEQQAGDRFIGDTIHRQLGDADLIVLNKTDLLGETEQQLRIDWLGQAQPDRPIVSSVHGKVPLEMVLQSFDHVANLEGRSVSGHHHKSEIYKSERLSFDGPVDVMAIARELAEAEPMLLRAKGFVEDQSGAMKTIQVTGRRFSVSDAPDGVDAGIVTIRLA